jgi:hypothetical protein
MSAESVQEWRSGVRGRIDGLQLQYDGIGPHRARHAIAYQTSCNGRRMWKVDVLERAEGGGFDLYTYGHDMPLTQKMAREIAERFVTGRKIPKRLEWR